MTKEWHAERAIFWSREVADRIERLRIAKEELEAAQRARWQHEQAAADDDRAWRNR